MQVPMHKLKAGLSRYVARARQGEVVEITSHDKPVARLVGIPSEAMDGIAALISRGAASWAGGKPAFTPVALKRGGKTLSEIVLEDRG